MIQTKSSASFYKYKVCFTLYTWLSQSLARLSRRFYLLSKFLTLCTLMVARTSQTDRSSKRPDNLLGLFVVSQPFLNIRLPTYSSAKLADKNLKSLGCTGFARHYYRHRCLLSFPRGTKMFQFPRFPSRSLCIQLRMIRHDPYRISPFGHLRIKA